MSSCWKIFLAGILFFVLIGMLGYASESEVLPHRPPMEIIYSDQTVQTASRSLQYRQRVSDQVTVITREELETWPVRDLDEALGLITGMVVRNDGLLGQAATAQIQGSKSQEVRVLVDGITFNPTTTGGIADLSQIPLDIVEKIEIVKGASSSTWGSAMGGVVNIITKPAGQKVLPAAEGTFSWGEFGMQQNRGEVSGKAGPAGYYIFGSHAEDEGFRPNSKEFENRAFFKSEAPVGEDFKAHSSFGYSGTENGEFEFPLSGSLFRRKVYSRYGSAGFNWDPGTRWHHQADYKFSERRFRRDFRLLPDAGLFRFTKAQSVIHEISTQSTWDLTDNQTITAGADIGVEVLKSAIFQFATANGTTLSQADKSSTRQGYYANYQLTWERLDIDLGSRLDSTNSYGAYFDPSAGLVFHLPFYGSNFRANVARAFNAPSFVDRYVSTATLAANPDLEAEKAIAYNLGLETRPLPWLHSQGTFFQTFLEDAIETIRRSDGLSQPVNISSERRTGFETETSLGPWQGFRPSYGVMVVKAVKPGYGSVQSRPRFTQDVKMNYRAHFKATILNVHIAGRFTDLTTGYGATDPADSTFIFDGKVTVTLPEIRRVRLTLFVIGKNLLNKDFSVDPGNDPNPQRNFEAGFKVRCF